MELFHFDIETCGEHATWEDFLANDATGAALFEKKWQRMRWSETETIEDAYLNHSPIISTYGKICCISFGFFNNDQKRIKSYYGNDEKQILLDFKEMLIRIEKKSFNLSGFRIWYFDIPWILHKMHKYGITPPNILSIYDKKPWETRIVDMAEDWKQKFAWSSSFDEVCYELNIPSPKDKIDGSEVHGKYWVGAYDNIKEYCEKDVSASLDMDRKIYQEEEVF